MTWSLRCVGILALVCAPGGWSLWAAEKTPLPEFTGQRVYVAGVEDRYDPVRDEIARVESGSRQTYYLAVIPSAGEGANAARQYVDALYDAWVVQAAQQGRKLDPDRSVIILLAIENRALAVHPGIKLQTDLGLSGDTIDAELARPYFVPHARAGDYPAGLVALVRQIERWIAAKEGSPARPRPPVEQAANPQPESRRAVSGMWPRLTRQPWRNLPAVRTAVRRPQARWHQPPPRRPPPPQAARVGHSRPRGLSSGFWGAAWRSPGWLSVSCAGGTSAPGSR